METKINKTRISNRILLFLCSVFSSVKWHDCSKFWTGALRRNAAVTWGIMYIEKWQVSDGGNYGILNIYKFVSTAKMYFFFWKILWCWKLYSRFLLPKAVLQMIALDSENLFFHHLQSIRELQNDRKLKIHLVFRNIYQMVHLKRCVSRFCISWWFTIFYNTNCTFQL